MKQYESFIFRGYEFNPSDKTLLLKYSLDEAVNFQERYRFDFDFDANVDQKLLEAGLQSLFYMAGVSYYKTYLPAKIILNQSAPLDQESAEFFSRTWQNGLGEFFYVNQIDPKIPVYFQPNSSDIRPINNHGHEGMLVGIGGGKDSLVSVEILRSQPKVATFSVGHRPQLAPLVERIGLPHFWVEREWDRKLLELNKQNALNGHIPISAIFACVGSVIAALTGYRDVVVSNESSASEPTLHYQDVDINHQYSKSLGFEKDFQSYAQHRWDETLRYYSFLRPFSELQIAELFSQLGFAKYKDVFSSCNRAFTHDSHRMFWCGQCAKCAFTFLILTPFIPRVELERLWGSKNLLLDPTLEGTYRQLLGIEGDKPLDCVGDIKESRSAMELAKKQYPELEKYTYEIPSGYDFRSQAPHSMPEEVAKLLFGRTE